MKIYTKTGDGGTTSLIGGTRVGKDHPRVEAYGSVDELMAHLGYLRDNLSEEEESATRGDLLTILNDLMVLSATLACEDESTGALPELTAEHVRFLEERIDAMQRTLPKLDKFTLPGGHPWVSLAHIARTVCRRAERNAVTVGSRTEAGETAVRYLNRLSDYLYTLGRKIAADRHAEELLWIPKK
jgi:cob(I)alamin adenosyltransferase